MIVIRRRLLYWIIKEYIKRWGKTIFVSFILGFLFFFILYLSSGYFISKIPIGHKEKIGVLGDYTLETLPNFILSDLSMGLTNLRNDNQITSGIAKSYSVKDNGKTYEFRIKPNLYFSDGIPVSSNAISYQFSEVTIDRPAEDTIIFKLKEPYAPFLTKVSRPLFRKGFVGIGPYKIKDVDLNNSFVKKLTLVSVKNKYDVRIYKFYPTEDALKLTFILGENTKIIGVSNTVIKKININSFPNASVDKKTNYQKLVALFYNNQDKILSEKRLREALSYALPDTFIEGERSYYPYAPNSWYFEQSVNEPKKDIQHAKLFYLASNVATSSGTLQFEIKTFKKYENTAKKIADSWKELGVKTNVKLVDRFPDTYQIFLGDYSLLGDPDQYSLWHSDQNNNITRYKNLRIDKLLEDGRKTVDATERRKIYADFQKYLLDDAPASFLYFPYEYEITRK